jgi:outer membrane receptor protein involved in Fe transport
MWCRTRQRLDAYTTADIYAFLDIPGRDVAMPKLENLRISMRVRNLTNVESCEVILL